MSFVGYQSKPNYENDDCWFFLMKYPFKKIKKKDWLYSVNPRFNNIEQLLSHYRKQLYNRDTFKRDIENGLLDLKKLIIRRF